MDWQTWAQIMLMMGWGAFLITGIINSVIHLIHGKGGKTDGR